MKFVYMNKQYIVIDLDTTIADNTHREHHIKDGKKVWNAFFEKMIDDAVYPCVNAVVQSMHKSGYGIIVLTARHVRYRMYTVSWLLKNDIPYDLVIMKDTTPNQERAPYFKLRALETLTALRFPQLPKPLIYKGL